MLKVYALSLCTIRKPYSFVSPRSRREKKRIIKCGIRVIENIAIMMFFGTFNWRREIWLPLRIRRGVASGKKSRRGLWF